MALPIAGAVLAVGGTAALAPALAGAALGAVGFGAGGVVAGTSHYLSDLSCLPD